jgi:HAD superfamily hydrolase (TIGR01490 family)
VTLAFFDLDRTLISKNSGAMWLLKEIRERRLTTADTARGLFGLLRYSLGYVELEALVLLAISRLQGAAEAELRRRIVDFYHQEVVSLYRPRAREVLAQHRDRGDRVVLLTSASLYLSELVSAELGLDDVLCTRFEVDAAGLFSGRPHGDICFGRGKLVHARAYAERAGTTLERATFYTDSLADLPVLEVVGRPVAVNPDPRLKRIAVARRWPVEDWGA